MWHWLAHVLTFIGYIILITIVIVIIILSNNSTGNASIINSFF
jgi:hypothetical protein